MIIDSKNKAWIVLAAGLLIVATAVYVPYHLTALNGPSGGSTVGLWFGFSGYGLMLVVMALALRKKLRTLRVGKTYHWMQAHVWLGLLAYPVILYHAGFSWGGALTQVIMWLFTIVVVSGIFGLVMQNVIPGKLFRDVRMETVYDQIDRIVQMIREDAESRMRTVADEAGKSEAYELEYIAAGAPAAAMLATANPGVRTLERFYRDHVRPFLHDEAPADGKLSTGAKAELVFEQVRKTVPPSLHETLDDLAHAVEERRDLARQKHLHRWMHGWLLVHVPLSYALMLLATWHAIKAWQYT